MKRHGYFESQGPVVCDVDNKVYSHEFNPFSYWYFRSHCAEFGGVDKPLKHDEQEGCHCDKIATLGIFSGILDIPVLVSTTCV